MNRRKKRSRSSALHIPTGTINPDGVNLFFDWRFFEPGMSVFIPAVNTVKLNAQVGKITRKRGFVVKGVERIEGGLLGMRFWRIS